MRIPRWFTARMISIILVLFVFLVPVVPATVAADNLVLVSNRDQCHGLGQAIFEPVFTSIPTVLYGLVIFHSTHQGLFGLVVVPGNGWYTVQFPPIGFKPITCL